MTFATLLYGEPSDVRQILDRGDQSLQELSAAMCNAFSRIDVLEKQLQIHRNALSKACGDDQDIVRAYLDSQRS